MFDASMIGVVPQQAALAITRLFGGDVDGAAA
jgi:hypothetical protein